MKKGIIKEIGIVVVELVGNRRRRVVKFWVIDECSKFYMDDKLCGYSVKELKQIAKTRDILCKLDTLDKPVRITIPPGRYVPGIFNVPLSTRAG